MEPNEETQRKVAMARSLMRECPNNVCFGRGYPLIALQQGSLYKQLLKDNCGYYHREVRLKSQFVEQRVVKPVHELGGKFFVWSPGFDRWVEAGRHETYTIVAQALRDEFKKMKKVTMSDVDDLPTVGGSSGERPGIVGSPSLDSIRHDETVTALNPTNESTVTRCTSVENGADAMDKNDSFTQTIQDRTSEPVTSEDARSHAEGDSISTRDNVDGCDPTKESTAPPCTSVENGADATDEEDVFAQTIQDRTSKPVTNEDPPSHAEGGPISARDTVDGSHGKDLLSLIGSISSSECRLRCIREAIQNEVPTGKFDNHLESLKGSLASIDEGLTSIELAVGIRSV